MMRLRASRFPSATQDLVLPMCWKVIGQRIKKQADIHHVQLINVNECDSR